MNYKHYCNILLNNFLGILNKHRINIKDCGITPDEFVVLSKLLYTGAIDKKRFREIVDKRIEEYKNNF